MKKEWKIEEKNEKKNKLKDFLRRKFEAKNLLYKVPPHFIRLGILVFRIVVYLKLKRRKKMIITVIAIVIRKKN